jgi:hypothetical protein
VPRTALVTTAGKEKQTKAKALTVVALCALAFPAAGVASHVTLPPTPENICGIDVITTETGSGVLKIVGSGVELNAFEIDLTYTNPANGKAVVLHGAELNEDTFSSPTDNGDGTISVFTKFAGVTKLTIPHGPPLAINAGELSARITVDATTLDFVSFQVLSSGGQPTGEDFCSVVVAALT